MSSKIRKPIERAPTNRIDPARPEQTGRKMPMHTVPSHFSGLGFSLHRLA